MTNITAEFNRAIEDITGGKVADIASSPISSCVSMNGSAVSSFQNPNISEIPPRGSVLLQMNRIARLKDAVRTFIYH